MINKLFLIIIDFFSTTFFTGKISGAKGTYGSFVAIIIMYYVFPYTAIRLLLTVIIIIIGTFFADICEKKIYKKKDASEITVDEVAGIFVSFLYLYRPYSFKYKYLILLITGFLIFRFFDILKPYPINVLQKIKGGPGIMIDDLLAGIYTLFLINIISYFIG